MRPLHVILGAGGAVGTPLARLLLAKAERLRLVSRSGRGPAEAERLRADLNDRAAVLSAVDEGATVYLLAGLKYDRKTWRAQWPRIMRNAVEACAAKRARLLFLDNVYIYGAVDGPMTEQTPVRPSSAKGAARAETDRILERASEKGRVTALIARAADFYGPWSDATSIPGILILKRLAAGKRAQVLVSADTRHSYSYTVDCAEGLVRLAGAEDAFGQVWHLPTARPAPTGRQFVELAARILGVEPRLSVMPRWMLRAGGLFNPMVRELVEMLYQNDRDYIFDSSKFERRFALDPTRYEDGVRATVEAMRSG